MAQLTFLFTDLEDSNKPWQPAPMAMHDALARHDATTHAAVNKHIDRIVKTTGDCYVSTLD